MENEKNKPVDKLRAKGVEASLWKNSFKGKDDKQIEFHTFSVKRSYKDKNDEWQDTKILREQDVPVAITLLQVLYTKHLTTEKPKEEKQE